MSNDIAAEVLADPRESSEAGTGLQSCPKLRQGCGGCVFTPASHWLVLGCLLGGVTTLDKPVPSSRKFPVRDAAQQQYAQYQGGWMFRGKETLGDNNSIHSSPPFVPLTSYILFRNRASRIQICLIF